MKCVFLLVLFSSFTCAKFSPSEKVPLDRLMVNVKKHFTEYGNQAEAHYLLRSARKSGVQRSSRLSGSLSAFKRQAGHARCLLVLGSGDRPRGPAVRNSVADEDEGFFLLEYRSLPSGDRTRFERSAVPLQSWLDGRTERQRFAAQLRLPPINLTSGDQTTWRLLADQGISGSVSTLGDAKRSHRPGTCTPCPIGESPHRKLSE